MSEIRSLPQRKTFKGHDAYCHICWNAVYVLWVSDEDPMGKCPHGHSRARDCPDAQARDGLSAFFAQCRRDGLLPPLPTEDRS